MLFIRHRLALLLPQLEQPIGRSLAVGIGANLSNLSIC
jgi:hypothetical protein